MCSGDRQVDQGRFGTLTLAHASSFTGGVELKGGTLIVSHASGMGTNKNLSVTGNAAIGGISAGYGGLFPCPRERAWTSPPWTAMPACP